MWFFEGRVITEWKSTGSLLWIYEKRAFLLVFSVSQLLTDSDFGSWIREKRDLVCCSSSSPTSGRISLSASSSVIQDIMAICEAGSAIIAYFYFDFRDLDKRSCHDLLLSLVSQLSTRSRSYCDILHRVYEAHEKGARQPSDDTLKECLKDMLRLPEQGPVFIILDALDECPDSSGFPSPRDEVLQFVKELVVLRLPEVHICATSRPEVDIRAVLEPLAFYSISLHDESGQKRDIADYIRNVVNLSPSMAMKRWRHDEKSLVIETLTEGADGM